MIAVEMPAKYMAYRGVRPTPGMAWPSDCRV